VVVFGYIEGPFLVSKTGCARERHAPCIEGPFLGHETANWGGRGLGYMLFNAHLCNQPYYCQSGGGTEGTALCIVRGVGSGSRDVDVWTQTSLHAEDRGLPSTDDPGA
jgi:hypothetical protein